MKKTLVLLAVCLAALLLVACGDPTPAVTTGAAETDALEPTDAPETTAPDAGESIATQFLAGFETLAAADGTSAEEIANGLCGMNIVPWKMLSAPIEAGWNTGFDEEITGFAEGVTFRPMIGTHAFVGYVFRLENAADADAFIATLKNVSNPRWNICTEADETVAAAVGNYVFFVMAPLNVEEEAF